jgi:hypothetical protein
LLTGAELEDALHRWSLIDDSNGIDSTVTESEIQRLQEELAMCRRNRDELKLLHDRLAVHHTVLTDRLARLDLVTNSARSEYQQSTEQIQQDNISVSIGVVLNFCCSTSLLLVVQQLVTQELQASCLMTCLRS